LQFAMIFVQFVTVPRKKCRILKLEHGANLLTIGMTLFIMCIPNIINEHMLDFFAKTFLFMSLCISFFSFSRKKRHSNGFNTNNTQNSPVAVKPR
jgi:hypothetical protein